MIRILVIDDDPNVRQMLCSMLEREGFETETAVNGHQGMAQFRANPAQLVITDIIMPEQEGIETIRQLKTEFPDVPVIAMSGGGRIGPSDYLSMAKLLGAAYTLSKPFDRTQLLIAVRDVLGASLV
ncbi:MAG: response regulator [bacterium]|nr:response regulator [bacterium]